MRKLRIFRLPSILLLGLTILAGCSKTEEKRAVSPTALFSVGPYSLDASIAGVEGLVEWSTAEYNNFGRQYRGEKNYHAPPVTFQGRQWKLIIGTVNGKIYKLVPHEEFTDKAVGNAVAADAVSFYREGLGEPAKPRPGLFIWDKPEANVIVQTAEARDGMGVQVFLTSAASRAFEPAS